MKLQTLILLILGPTLTSWATAQELEPGVQTSAPPVAPATHTAIPAATASTPARAGNAPKTSAAGPKPATSVAAAPPGNKSSDRIQLDTTQISGNQELPKVMYVVPWRRADPGEFSGRPPNSLLDEALRPVDRDVFKRQNRYYGALQGQSQAATAAPVSKDEK